MDFEDSATCLARFESGTTAVINVGWFSEKYQQKVELFGTVRHALARNVPPNRVFAAIQMLTMNTSTFFQPYIAELGHFANSIASDTHPSPSGIDGLKDVEAIELAYKNSIGLTPAEANHWEGDN
jgi:predicted dehydrogenase